jgi:hypothetical protein
MAKIIFPLQLTNLFNASMLQDRLHCDCFSHLSFFGTLGMSHPLKKKLAWTNVRPEPKLSPVVRGCGDTQLGARFVPLKRFYQPQKEMALSPWLIRSDRFK